MTEERLPHRLSVVWFTDLVGAPQILTTCFFAPLRSDPRFAEIRRKLGLG